MRCTHAPLRYRRSHTTLKVTNLRTVRYQNHRYLSYRRCGSLEEIGCSNPDSVVVALDYPNPDWVVAVIAPNLGFALVAIDPSLGSVVADSPKTDSALAGCSVPDGMGRGR